MYQRHSWVQNLQALMTGPLAQRCVKTLANQTLPSMQLRRPQNRQLRLSWRQRLHPHSMSWL
eukprot:6198101-Pleurochrysis_carterae.AAC.1